MTSKTKVAIIGTVGLPANYGGFETLADHLVKNLGGAYDFTVYCSSKKYEKKHRQKNYHGAKLKFLPLDANGIQSIFYDSISIIHALFFSEVLLILGVAGAWMLPFVRFFTNKKIIISIDGIEWKRDKWSRFAKMYLWWAEKIAVQYAHIDISDNESIQDYTALRYKSLSRIIEYGADHAAPVEISEAIKFKFPFLQMPYAFKVCRIEPENNIHLVLAAFAKLPKRQLVFIGNWNNSPYGQNLRAQYADSKNIHMLDPIYDQQILDMFRSNAILYIHGHSAGGTNPSLVEAMYLKLPIFSFDVSYNRTTTENSAAYFSDTNGLIHLVESYDFEKLQAMGKTLKSIADRRYTWSIIAEKYRLLIVEALTATVKPTVKSKLSQNPEILSKKQLAHLKFQKFFYEK